MTAISRRTFVMGAAGAAALPLLAGAGLSVPARATAGTVLLHDPSLAAGRRFAAHAARLEGRAIALEGDRIRFMRALLTGQPAALYGVTRHSDQLLLGEVAREAGYRAIALIQHRADGGITPDCQPGAAAIATVAGGGHRGQPLAGSLCRIGDRWRGTLRRGEGTGCRRACDELGTDQAGVKGLPPRFLATN
ncbi:hypothetical protein GCM10007897_38300 [Sphingobium jiangsuense]|uniref:hypothetical protein n=1 Tax=Sphingobium jiangsuense TaxID=870476 RepID=UPI00235C3058|nr:hypothetical protein [Sphingobium jiangsuense]GLT02421.1 hypothetical protein GCM10007897_38300 [Sphingobium jiangsuense]